MKRLLAAFCVLTALGANAQRAEWGLKAGLQISQLRGDDFLGRRVTSSSATPETITTQGSSKAGYVVAVSYTHLDVYKRQPHQRRGTRVPPAA